MKSIESSEKVLRCYQLEHREHYQKLVSELPEALRRDWVAFVEDTARNCLQRGTGNIIGTPLPGFNAIREAIRQRLGRTAITPETQIIVAFSFGANFPFCSLAFRYLGDVWETLRKAGAAFACLFPPESAASESSSSGAVPTLIDTHAERAAHCGLRYNFPERFNNLSRSIPWFPGYGTGETPAALTLPGTCFVSSEGTIRDLHLPADVTRRLPPPSILERLQTLNPSN